MNINVLGNSVLINRKKAKRLYTQGARECFVGNGIIVKLNDKLYRQSSTELRRWRNIDSKDRKYFARPIVGQIMGNGWIAQKIIKFRRGRRSKHSKQVAEALFRKYGIRDLFDTDGSFLDYPVNWGVRKNGSVVIYDWGY